MSRIRLLSTASFRLAALYLALFTASALALGAFVYFSVRHEILTDFDKRIVEESDALKSVFVDGGRDRLAAIIGARGSSLQASPTVFWRQTASRSLETCASRGPAPLATDGSKRPRTTAKSHPSPRRRSSALAHHAARRRSSLLVGDERRRPDTILTGVLAAFAWAVAATLAMGTIGGLWLSAQFLGRIESMRHTARRLMDGDWKLRRIPR